MVDAAVIGGKDRWSRRLRGLENEFRRKLEEAEDQEHGESERAYIEKQLEHLKHLENFALPVIDFLGSLASSAPWGEWLSTLSRLAGMALRHPDSVFCEVRTMFGVMAPPRAIVVPEVMISICSVNPQHNFR